jgi:hypothetical protein
MILWALLAAGCTDVRPSKLEAALAIAEQSCSAGCVTRYETASCAVNVANDICNATGGCDDSKLSDSDIIASCLEDLEANGCSGAFPDTCWDALAAK